MASQMCGGSWRVSPTKIVLCERSATISASGGVALPASSRIATANVIALTSGLFCTLAHVPAITLARARRSWAVRCGPIDAR